MNSANSIVYHLCLLQLFVVAKYSLNCCYSGNLESLFLTFTVNCYFLLLSLLSTSSGYDQGGPSSARGYRPDPLMSPMGISRQNTGLVESFKSVCAVVCACCLCLFKVLLSQHCSSACCYFYIHAPVFCLFLQNECQSWQSGSREVARSDS